VSREAITGWFSLPRHGGEKEENGREKRFFANNKSAWLGIDAVKEREAKKHSENWQEGKKTKNKEEGIES